MSRILRVGRIGGSEETERTGTLPLVLVFGLGLALLGIGWYRSHSADAAERDRLEERLSRAEDDLSDLKGAAERCRAELSVRPTTVPVAAPRVAAELPHATGHAPAAPEPTNQAPALTATDAAAED
jgi:hypothetical protein